MNLSYIYIELTIGVTEYTTLLGRKKKGLCSKWLESYSDPNYNEKLISKNKIFFSINSGSLPKVDKNDHVIIIATGTGIAPFRNFLWERFHKSKSENYLGTCTMFYGCRNKQLDFLYGDELEMFKNSESMKFNYFAAFSRDQNEKIYVQHLIKEKEDFIYDLVFMKKCYVFIVGNSKVLPKSIDNALRHIFYQNNKEITITDDEWNKILNFLKKSGKFYIETW